MTMTKLKSLCLCEHEVRALLADGRATLVRAVKYPTAEYDGVEECCYSGAGWAFTRRNGGGCSCRPARCPFGRVVERCVVKEPWSPDHAAFYLNFPIIYKTGSAVFSWGIESGKVFSPEVNAWFPFRWRSSATMPLYASRLTIETVAVRCERDAAGVWEWHGDVRRAEQC